MPTENRSSNTEQHDHIEGIIDMVSVPRVLTREMLNGVCMHPDLAKSLWSALLKNAPRPAEQHHGEALAWMVGAAIWWSKAEAESDAELVGEPVVPLGPYADSGEVESLKADKKAFAQNAADLRAEVERLRLELSAVKFNLDKADKGLLAADSEVRRLRTQLAERDTLLRNSNAMIKSAIKGLEKFNEDMPLRWCGYLDDALGGLRYQVEQIEAALSDIAEPAQRDHEIPGTSFQRLNMLANQGE